MSDLADKQRRAYAIRASMGLAARVRNVRTGAETDRDTRDPHRGALLAARVDAIHDLARAAGAEDTREAARIVGAIDTDRARLAGLARRDATETARHARAGGSGVRVEILTETRENGIPLARTVRVTEDIRPLPRDAGPRAIAVSGSAPAFQRVQHDAADPDRIPEHWAIRNGGTAARDTVADWASGAKESGTLTRERAIDGAAQIRASVATIARLPFRAAVDAIGPLARDLARTIAYLRAFGRVKIERSDGSIAIVDHAAQAAALERDTFQAIGPRLRPLLARALR